MCESAVRLNGSSITELDMWEETFLFIVTCVSVDSCLCLKGLFVCANLHKQNAHAAAGCVSVGKTEAQRHHGSSSSVWTVLRKRRPSDSRWFMIPGKNRGLHLALLAHTFVLDFIKWNALQLQGSMSRSNSEVLKEKMTRSCPRCQRAWKFQE